MSGRHRLPLIGRALEEIGPEAERLPTFPRRLRIERSSAGVALSSLGRQVLRSRPRLALLTLSYPERRSERRSSWGEVGLDVSRLEQSARKSNTKVELLVSGDNAARGELVN